MNAISETQISKLISGAGRGLVGSVGGRALGLFGSIFAARILGPAGFGLYAIGWTLLRFFSLIAPLGLDKGVIRFSSKYLGKDDAAHKGILLQALGISLISGIGMGVLLFYIAPWLAREVYHNPNLVIVFRYFSFAFPPMVLLTVVAAATRSTQHVGYSVLIHDLGQPLLGLILMVIFYFMGLGLIGVVLSDILSLVVAVLVGFIVLVRLFPQVFSKNIKMVFLGRELLAFSLPASFAAAFVVYIYWVDRLLIGYFRTPLAFASLFCSIVRIFGINLCASVF